MPPDLIALGDQLEAAAARALGRRFARRQSVLNVVASLVIAVPFALAIASADLPNTALDTFKDATPVVAQPARTGYPSDAAHIPADARVAYLRNGRTPELLILPTTLRPALR